VHVARRSIDRFDASQTAKVTAHVNLEDARPQTLGYPQGSKRQQQERKRYVDRNQIFALISIKFS